MHSAARRRRLLGEPPSKTDEAIIREAEKEAIASAVKKFEDKLKMTEKLFKGVERERRQSKKKKGKKKGACTTKETTTDELAKKASKLVDVGINGLQTSQSQASQLKLRLPLSLTAGASASTKGSHQKKEASFSTSTTGHLGAVAEAEAEEDNNSGGGGGGDFQSHESWAPLRFKKTPLARIMSRRVLTDDLFAQRELALRKKQAESHVDKKVGYAFEEAFKTSHTYDEIELMKSRKQVSVEHQIERFKNGTKSSVSPQKQVITPQHMTGRSRRASVQGSRAGSRCPSPDQGSLTGRGGSTVSSIQSLQSLKKKFFGPYEAEELLEFLKAFNSLPHVTIIVGNDAAARSQNSRKSVVSATTDIGALSSRLGYGASSSSRNDDSALSSTTTIQDSLKEYINLDFLRENIAVQVEALIAHGFIRMRPKFRESLTRALELRVAQGVVSRHVHMNMVELLIAVCPFMTPADRKECIKFFAINAQEMAREEASNAAAEPELTAADVEKLQKMFQFFDKNKTGKIMSKDIMAGLGDTSTGTGTSGGARSSSAQNKHKYSGAYDDSDSDEDNPHFSEDNFQFNKIIAAVGVDEQTELNFAEFVQLYKGILL
jgi:Ca2+-binding EF-hand superfamily protein